MKTIKVVVFLLLLSCLIGCGQIDNHYSGQSDLLNSNSVAIARAETNLAEVATPSVIKKLQQELTEYVPQVKIYAPQEGETVEPADLEVKLEVKGLPIFRDDNLGLGNHLNLIIDNEPLQGIYSVDEPIVLKNLTPGTHTLRIFAVRPWGESYKNQGAYAQRTFSVLTPTNDNHPQANIPLLTYNSPTGTIGAEPLLLDYYLTNIGHSSELENSQDAEDVIVRVTINGTSFMLQDWQPRYLTGLELGENWIQLELLDQAGNKIVNDFNDTVRVITYDPKQQDTLAKLVSNQIALADAQAIVKHNYDVKSVATSKIIDQEDNGATVNSSELQLENQVQETSEEKQATDSVTEIDEPQSVQDSEPALRKRQTEIESQIPVSITQDGYEPDTTAGEDYSSTLQDVTDDSSKLDSNIISLPDEPEKTEATNVTIKTEPEQAAINSDTSGESEIASKTPQTIAVTELQPEPGTSTNQTKTLWWKKLLVKLRQTIEAIANRLPQEV